MKDYALRLSGLPWLDGTVRMEEELKENLVQSLPDILRKSSRQPRSKHMGLASFRLVPIPGPYLLSAVRDCLVMIQYGSEPVNLS